MKNALLIIMAIIATVFGVYAESYTIKFGASESFDFDCHKNNKGLYELFVKYSDFIDENYEYITEVSGSDSFLLFETSFDMTHCETFLEESGKISYDGLKMELTYTQFVDDEDIEDDDIEWDSNESVIFRKKLDVTEWNKFSAYLKRCQKLINDSYNGTNKNR